jgi:hypothetical protein
MPVFPAARSGRKPFRFAFFPDGFFMGAFLRFIGFTSVIALFSTIMDGCLPQSRIDENSRNSP